MPRKHLSLVLLVAAALALGTAQASNTDQLPKQFASFSAGYVLPTASLDTGGTLFFPASPDNWLGGAGNWSNGADWSAGLPGTNSDVLINTGNDTVTLDTSFSINSLTLGGSTGSSQLTADGNAHTLTIAGALTVNQSGNLYLSGDTMTAGANSTNVGIVSIEYGSSLHVNGNLNNSGTLNEGLSNDSSGNALTVTGTLTNSGTIGIGYYNINSGGNGSATVGGLSNTGTINLGGGPGGTPLQVNGNATNAGAINLQLDSSFTVSGNLLNSGAVQIIDTDSGCCTQVSIAGTLTNTSSGSFTVAGDVSGASLGALVNQGQITVRGGYVSMASLGVAGNVANSGIIAMGPSDGMEQVSIGGTLTNSASGQFNMNTQFDQATIGNVVNSGAVNIQGYTDSISIPGKLTNNATGTFSLSSPSDIANVGYIANAGTVFLASRTNLNVTGGPHSAINSVPGFLNSGIVDISSGATLASPLTFTQTSGQTTVDGTLNVSSRAVINLAGGSVYGNGGTIQGSIISDAAINVGDASLLLGQLTFMGNYTQLANGSLTFDIAGPANGQYDQLNVSGHAQLNGLMTVDLLHGYVPQIGNTFDIMNFASGSGTFSMVLGLPINNQEHFVLEYNPTNLILDVAAGQVMGPTATGHGAFSANDPFIPGIEQTGDDYASNAPNSNGTAGSTPEPGSFILFGSGVLGLAAWRRRRRWV